jgi:hypothetical protein
MNKLDLIETLKTEVGLTKNEDMCLVRFVNLYNILIRSTQFVIK